MVVASWIRRLSRQFLIGFNDFPDRLRTYDFSGSFAEVLNIDPESKISPAINGSWDMGFEVGHHPSSFSSSKVYNLEYNGSEQAQSKESDYSRRSSIKFVNPIVRGLIS